MAITPAIASHKVRHPFAFKLLGVHGSPTKKLAAVTPRGAGGLGVSRPLAVAAEAVSGSHAPIEKRYFC